MTLVRGERAEVEGRVIIPVDILIDSTNSAPPLFGRTELLAGCEVDHVISRKHGGVTDLANLALSCERCNRAKGSDVGSIVGLSQGWGGNDFGQTTIPASATSGVVAIAAGGSRLFLKSISSTNSSLG